MSAFNFLSVRPTPKFLAFMLTFKIANQHYVAARVCLQGNPLGLTDSGCFLAEQSVEMFVKAILHLGHKSKDIHYLPKLLARGNGKVAYFDKLLTDPKLSYFIQNLTLVNSKMRFGEAGGEIRQQELTEVLDEVAFNLRKIYFETIKATDDVRLYVPDEMKDTFLANNKYFLEADITDNPLAISSLGVSLPAFPPKRASTEHQAKSA